jgi:prophage regulatory protein
MRIISPAELSPLKGITFTNVWRLELERLGKFPKRIKLGVRRYGYLESELDQWLEERAAGRQRNSESCNSWVPNIPDAVRPAPNPIRDSTQD